METKKQFKYFSIFSYEKEQEYLDQMHRSGWKFVKVSGLGMYHFEKCQPQSVAYRLDYNKEGLAHKEEYVKLYSDCGWEYIQDYAGYSYFRKAVSEHEETEEIFCDQDSKMEMMERVLKGRMTPLLVIFSATLLPQFVINLIGKNYYLAALFGGFMAVYVGIFLKCFRTMSKYKKAAQ
jgi:hypothetical protein